MKKYVVLNSRGKMVAFVKVKEEKKELLVGRLKKINFHAAEIPLPEEAEIQFTRRLRQVLVTEENFPFAICYDENHFYLKQIFDLAKN